MDKTYYVTTPIYYVNASPHIGHAYTTIVADVLARYHKLSGYRTFFMTGTDEHGDKIAEAAQKAGIDPKTYADRISAQFRALWPELNVRNDYFIRTTDENHVRVVQMILQKVYDAGDIYFGHYEGHYCVGCERFYMEKELVDGLCPDHQCEPEHRKESNYFFRMSKYQDWLIQYIEEHPDFIRPERYRNEALAFLREPLEDLCISRPKSRLTWGITLPFDADYVTYVWFDALINYITGIGYPDGENFRTFWPAAEHLIAKDILKPHGIYWPTMLKAAGIEPYRHLNVHGYWNVDQSKMSKSLGNVVKPLELKDKYGLDAFRYFLLRDMVFGLDSSFSEEAFVQRVNSDLANDLGNLISRVMAMAFKYYDGRVPVPGTRLDQDEAFIAVAGHTRGEVDACFRELSLHKALMAIWEFVNAANKYIVENEPWRLAKEAERNGRLATVIYNLLEALRFTAVFISPFMPGTAEKVLTHLGIAEVEAQDFSTLKVWGGLPSGNALRKIAALFPRIDYQKEEKMETQAKAAPVFKPEIAYEDFEKIDLRIAKVLEAEPVPKSSKLLKLKIDLGEERVIVAGMGKDYRPEEIVGKMIVVVANLKPTKLMGVESRGMLLATDTAAGLTLITGDRPPEVGAKVR
ncbi:MAG TPA: methionine--tRNA ligase [Syntrophales bacterium]|jgi:methionyl-tRNA synthetase|nr:methionine--tRNA ligase [Syntrophales bacterium]HON22646.1 methionine--tRNA ligase [Syntrophales bacterium]HOU78039.1 methionine--tRNA ligase [Syntrophales bacterium]HPC33032.1 methionine--tRNA ligase [Syntrophales bacterium]HQG34348.1 methionine--tRNA ligase [Syntrophales bacterium]